MKATASLAIAALALLPTPASADWETTRWGMSPSETLAALDGATSHNPAPDEIYKEAGKSYTPLVVLPVEIEGVAGRASLLFDADDRLTFVLFKPDQIADCRTLQAALTQRHGAPDTLGAGSILISDWQDNGDAVKLTSAPSAAICNLSYSAG